MRGAVSPAAAGAEGDPAVSEGEGVEVGTRMPRRVRAIGPPRSRRPPSAGRRNPRAPMALPDRFAALATRRPSSRVPTRRSPGIPPDGPTARAPNPNPNPNPSRGGRKPAARSRSSPARPSPRSPGRSRRPSVRSRKRSRTSASPRRAPRRFYRTISSNFSRWSSGSRLSSKMYQQPRRRKVGPIRRRSIPRDAPSSP